MPFTGQDDAVRGSDGLLTLLPGPDRKRSATRYLYRLTYRDPDPRAYGCVMTWEVRGGRLQYQLAIERDHKGRLHCHCTCADAVFRADVRGHRCKHIRGFLEATREPAKYRRGA
jgi:hypothetical protein